MIKYLGSKRTLLPVILDAVRSIPNARTVADVFSGTSRVGHALKREGYRVRANDHNAYAATLARCYVQADDSLAASASQLIAEFNALPGAPGYFTQTFCLSSRFFQPRNGERIDAIREAIARKSLDPELESVLLVSLMEAADRVDSTTGLQMAYLKGWAARSNGAMEMRLPALLPQARHGKGEAHQLDAIDAAERLEADIAYIDPPYNQHSYLGNYHIWESLVRWDKPEVYGVACKRLDVRERRSAFNSRVAFRDAFCRLIDAVTAPVLIISFSNEGYLSQEDLQTLLESRWGDGINGQNGWGNRGVTTIESDYKRYVGAQIGVFNQRGQKVGRVSHLRNKEYLYIVTRDRGGGGRREGAAGNSEAMAAVSQGGCSVVTG